MSVNALIESPKIYGGVNLIVFILLFLVSFWLFRKLSHENKDSKVRDFFLSEVEWEPIIKSTEILEQIKEYQNIQTS